MADAESLKDEEFLAKFSISFSWDYPDDWSLTDVQSAIFHVVDDRDTRCQDQLVCSGVQSSGCGVSFAQPNPETDVVPCEMTFMAHPIASEFCITKVLIVSEAKNLELYIDNMYEKTAKGLMLTLKKGRNPALYENEFDLSSHIQGSSKVTIKFVSLPEKNTMRLKTVVVKVAKCSPNLQAPNPALAMGMNAMNPKSVEMDNVRQIIQSLGGSVPAGGQNLMSQIENQQKLQALQLQQLLSMTATAGGLPFGVPQIPSLNQQLPRQPSSDHVSPSRPKYEESLLANAILNNEKLKRETQQALEEQQQKAQKEAQMNYLRQMLVGNESTQNRPASVASHDLFNEDLSQERNLSQMMARLMQESQGVPGQESPIDNKNDPFARSKLRSSLRSTSSRTNSIFGTKNSRPVSFSFSDTSDRDYQRQFSEPEDNTKHVPHHLLTNSNRCQECGCPGCLSVYNSITTNIYAMEERLLGRIDLKMQELSRHLDNKFDTLHDALFSRQEQFVTQLIDAIPQPPPSLLKKPAKDAVMYRSDEP